jgi:Sporulation and spore germination
VNPRWRSWLIAALVIAVIAAGLYLPVLKRRVRRAAQLKQQSEEQARRELAPPVPVKPDQPMVKAKLFWAAGPNQPGLAPVAVELPLSNDPVVRAKQVLNTLLAGPVDTDLRTLPGDAALLEFYLLPDGTAIADFSEAMGTSIPSGIDSEQLAIDSIARTLEANVPQVQRLKILLHGQEADTLAGHVDLAGTFVVNTKAMAAAEVLNPDPEVHRTASPEPEPSGATAGPPNAGATALTPMGAGAKLAAGTSRP